MFDHLFSPLRLGKVNLQNRVCFLAHRTNYGVRGRLTDRHTSYYCRRAAGGCGLIVVGELSIHPNDQPWESVIRAHEPSVVQDYRRLTDAVHALGTPIFAHLCHHGFQSSGAISRGAVWGPSAIADIAFGETAKPMEPEDMAEVCRAFATAAEWVREGGFDGIEIDMGPESLLRQFLSPISNHRQDTYGGSLENRVRLPLAVLHALRRAVGSDFTVGVRLCVDEKFWGGISVEDSRQFAVRFEASGGCDFINTAVGTYYNLHLIPASMHTPFGFTIEPAEQIKQEVKIPVLASHQLGFPHMADELVSQGRADAAGFVRVLICDPDAPKKAREGRLEDIRPCVKDNMGCQGRVNQSKALGCTLNPEVGYEKHRPMGSRPVAVVRKKVMVVGGGPAGMEAARIARRRGHDVTLYEQGQALGGQVSMIQMRPGRQAMGGIIRYLARSLEKLDIRVFTGVQVTPELVSEVRPDAVVVATGSRPVERPVPGRYGPPRVLNVWETLSGQYPVGHRVLFLDENGGHHATATVELLADQGKIVTMVTSDLFIGIELAPLGDLYLTRQRLLQKGVTFISDVVIDRIAADRVLGRDIYTNETVSFEDHDTIILDMGNVPADDLYFRLKGQVKELHRIGDCVAPRGIVMAIFEGNQVGSRL
jgi:mycofactocin system FadH/OYE family oxidoreductase 2